jgi:hypothetical protein
MRAARLGRDARSRSGVWSRSEETAVTASERSWPRLLAALLGREDLTADNTRWAMTEVMDNTHEAVQLAAFLTALHAKGKPRRRSAGCSTPSWTAPSPCPSTARR